MVVVGPVVPSRATQCREASSLKRGNLNYFPPEGRIGPGPRGAAARGRDDEGFKMARSQLHNMPAKKATKKSSKKAADEPADANQGPERGHKSGKNDPAFSKDVEVDYWATSLHGKEVGVNKKLKYQAKSRGRFSENMDIMGVVKWDDKDQIFAINEAMWEEPLPKKRLLIRWFRGESARVVGTIESMTIPSLRKSFSSNDELIEFRCVLPKYDYVVTIGKERTSHVSKLGKNYAFEMEMGDGTWEIFEFDEKRLTIGSDWEVFDMQRRLVAFVDEKKANIGGKFVVTFYDETLFKNKVFFRVVLLFAMAVKFQARMEKDVKKMMKKLRAGEMEIKATREEKAFMKNPRGYGRS